MISTTLNLNAEKKRRLVLLSKKRKIQLNLILTLFFIGFIVVRCPNLNPLYAEGAFAWCIVLSCYVILNFLLALGGIRVNLNPRNGLEVNFDRKAKGLKPGIILLGIVWILYFAISIFSMFIFNYKAYRDQLGTPEKSEFTNTVQPLALDQLPIVDKDLAWELADKKVGENPGMGSQIIVGKPVIQQVAGKLVWAVPLEHSGFFKWLKNRKGSAGYVVVSATDVNDVKLITQYKIKYQENAYLFDDLNRHVRLFKGGIFRGLTDYSFEIDDSGQPYWIITNYKNRWLFSLPEAQGVLIVNATTGETKSYKINEVPEWVDRVQPEEMIIQQIKNQGEFVHGFLNFSNQDKFRPSNGHIIVYNDSNCYLFTGLTSVGSDEAAIGFMMINMVTKESKLYQMSGATEIAAQQSAQGKVQQYGYHASFPMIINLDGKPTYFMTLKDNAGLIKQYAFVSVANYTNVGTGENITAALRNYRQVMNEGGMPMINGNETEKITGTILRIAGENLENSVTYKFILQEDPKLIFTAAYDISNELSLTQPGDKVTIEYIKSEEGICPVTLFDNLQFTQTKSQ